MQARTPLSSSPPGRVRAARRRTAQGVSLQWVCRACMVLSFFSAACAVGLMWGLYPKEYDLGEVRVAGTPHAAPAPRRPRQARRAAPGRRAAPRGRPADGALRAQVLGLASFFYNAQRVGHLPPDNGVAWRSDALLWEAGPGGEDLTGARPHTRPAAGPSGAYRARPPPNSGRPARAGGWLNGGAAGDLKMTVPTAFTVSLLAWGLLAFPGGYAAANQTAAGQASVRWGADYLLKTLIANSTGGNVSSIVYQARPVAAAPGAAAPDAGRICDGGGCVGV